VLSFEVPADDSTNVEITQASVNVTIKDPEGDLIDWSIEGLYVNDASGTDEANGSKQASLITPLPFATSIVWYVNASDGTDSTGTVYDFTTRSQYVPNIPSSLTATVVGITQIDLSWIPDTLADTTYIERNNAEDWSIGTGIEIYNGSDSSYSDTNLIEGTQYFYQAWSWNNTDLVYSITYDEANDTTPTNQAPVLSFEVPADDSNNVKITQTTVNVTIKDPEGNPLDWTIEGTYLNDASGTDEANGSKQASLITPLTYTTNIIWYVNATDGTVWTRETFFFTTESAPNTPPNMPYIDGPTSGKAGDEQEFIFSATDPHGDDISYFIDWGDDSEEMCIGPFSSGEEVKVNHIWSDKGEYLLKARAKDINELLSPWAILEVSMPKAKATTSPLLTFLENHPHLFPLLRLILGL
jgi:hypothetical protein